MSQVDVTNIQGYAVLKTVNQVELTNIQGYAIVAPAVQLSLRKFGGYAMTKAPAPMGLRAVAGYAMCTPFTPLPSGVTGLQAVLNMIAAKAKTVRPATDFTVDAPAVLANDPLFNSTVKAYATAASGLTGNKTFRYNRVPLSRMGLVSNAFDLGTFTTIYDLIPSLITASGVKITTDDINDGPIASTDVTVTLTSKAGSYWFLPNSSLTIGKTLPSINVPISSDTIDW